MKDKSVSGEKKNFWIDVDKRKHCPLVLWRFTSDDKADCFGIKWNEIELLKEALERICKKE